MGLPFGVVLPYAQGYVLLKNLYRFSTTSSNDWLTGVRTYLLT